MKHLFLIASLFSLVALTSCDLGDDSQVSGTYADSAAYLTACVVENIDDATKKEYYFLTDYDTKIFLADNQMTTTVAFSEGQRIIGYFALIESYLDDEGSLLEGAAYGCDYGMRLFDMSEVYTSESITVTTDEEEALLPDQSLLYVYDSVGYSYDYINFTAGVMCENLGNMKLYLVENLSQFTTILTTDYLNLELRFDSGSEDGVGTQSDVYISLDTSDFAEQLESKNGIIVSVPTTNSGTISIQVDK
ncbi:MAG: NigD-like C-terminal domain-containing protein [Rikenellaceae bacterium]